MKWLTHIKGMLGYFNRKGYSSKQPATLQMIQTIHIRCVNPNCTAHNEPVEYDVSRFKAIKVANEGEKGADSFIIRCPICSTENKIFLIIQEEKEYDFLQKIGLRGRPSQEDRGSSYLNSPF